MTIEKTKLLKIIEREKQEAQELQLTLSNKLSRISAFEEILKLIPDNGIQTKSNSVERTLRYGGLPQKTQSLLSREGKPLHIKEILERLDLPLTKANYLALASSIGTYAKNQRIFSKTAPNTFGLIDFAKSDLDRAE